MSEAVAFDDRVTKTMPHDDQRRADRDDSDDTPSSSTFLLKVVHLVCQQVLKLFFLPYGLRLLRPNAWQWIVSQWTLAIIMATVEGATWMKLMSVYLPAQYARYAMLIGSVWALSVFILDASFCTLDVSVRPAKTKSPASSAGLQAKQLGLGLRDKRVLGVFVRAVIIILSLLLTGPFMAKTLDEKLLLQTMSAQNDQAMASVRQKIDQGSTERITALEKQRQELSQRLNDETAGKLGLPAGHGPAARAVERNLQVIEAAITDEKARHDTELHRIDRASAQELTRVYGVHILTDNPEIRARLRAELDHNAVDRVLGLPGRQVVVSGLLVLLLLVMLSLKLYQPESVAMYYSDHLQEAHSNYRRGDFDSLPSGVLEPSYRSRGPYVMDGLQFEVWYQHRYLPYLEAIDTERERDAETEMLHKDIERLKTTQRTVETRHAQIDRTVQADTQVRQSYVSERSRVGLEAQRVNQGLSDTENAIRSAIRKEIVTRLDDIRARKLQLNKRRDLIGRDVSERIAADLDRVSHLILEEELRCDMALCSMGSAAAAAQNPRLATQYARRTLLQEERASLVREQFEIDQGLLSCDRELGQVEELLQQETDVGAYGFNPLSNELKPLYAMRRELQGKLDRTVVRSGELDEMVATADGRLAQSRSQLDEDARLLRDLRSDIQRKERELNARSGGKGARRGSSTRKTDHGS